MKRFERISEAFAEIRQALDKITIGYSEFKDALVIALAKQSLGIRGGHVLVFGPTGTAKTRTVKGLARILSSVGVPVPYERVQGNPDTMPSDFLFRRTAEYDEDGRLRFEWQLQKIGSFERKPDQILPGLFQFDELDKVTANGQFALLEVMEEQQVTVLDGRTVPLNFVLVATANTRKFDPTAKPLSRAVQDRFGTVVLLGYQDLEKDLQMLEEVTSSLQEPEIQLNHFPISELLKLRRQVQKAGLPLFVSEEMKRRIVTAVKLTQQKIEGYTDFTRYIKVPAGPRAILDLYWESGITALLEGTDELTGKYPLSVGVRVLRGRVEVTPEAEIEGMTTDVVIRKILAEVFGDFPQSSRPFEQALQGKSSTPEEKGEKVEEKSGGKAESKSQPQNQQSAQKPEAGQGQSQKDSPQPGDQSREESPADQSDWGKESFLASLRKEAQKFNGSKGRSESAQTGQDFQPGRGSSESGDSDESSRSQRERSQSASERRARSGGDGNNGQAKSVKTIASREALAQWLAQQAAAERFRTKEGIKTGAELAQDLATGPQKFDFQSTDGKFRAAVRGERVICQGNPEDIQKIVRQEESVQEFGQATTGGHLAGKGADFPTLDTFTLPPHITSVLPMLREMSGEKIVEKLGEWIQLPPNQKVRTGPEYRLIKGFVHLAALKAVRNSEEVESSELTLSQAGDRVDFVSGPRDDLPLDEERTILEALTQGGIVDDLSEVHEKRVRADAPQILFVLDGSGSMGYENRMMSAAVAAAATAQKYGPFGATFGLIAFTSNPALVVPMPENEVERVVDGIFSVSPGGGTSYARALELAFRHAPPKTTIVVLGDFIDSGELSSEALAIKNSKELKVIGIVSSAGNPSYATEICDEAYLVGFEDPTSVALIALKASVF